MVRRGRSRFILKCHKSKVVCSSAFNKQCYDVPWESSNVVY